MEANHKKQICIISNIKSKNYFYFLTNPLTDEILDGKGQIASDLKLLISSLS